MLRQAQVSLDGQLHMKVHRGPAVQAARAARVRVRAWRRRHWWVQRWRELPLELLLWCCGLLARVVPGFNVPMHGRLYARVLRADGTVEDYGHVGVHLIVTAGKNYLAACMDNTSEPEVLKYHGYGTGTTAAAAGDTTLQTELSTAYATDNVRPTGSQAHATNTYTTVATLTPDASVAATEWGLLSQAATGGGTLFDRQVYSVINLASGDSLQTTYVLTIG